MKKFVSGIVVGALFMMLMTGALAFADSVSLVGQKVQGLFSIQKAGVKVADAVIINGSAYAPVRAVAEATGTSLTVEGKTITMGDESSVTGQLQDLNIQRSAVVSKISDTEGGIKMYETTYIPNAQQYYDNYIGTDSEQQYKEWLEARTAELEQRKAELATLQQQLSDIDAQITALQN